MDNEHNHHVAPGAGGQPASGVDAPRSLFADDGPSLSSSHSAQLPPTELVKPKHRIVTRVVLPAAILVVGIASIAWVAQYLPGRGTTAPKVKHAAGTVEPLEFERTTFVWDREERAAPFARSASTVGQVGLKPDLAALLVAAAPFCMEIDKAYSIPEFELGKDGYYDYPFANRTPNEAELGVGETSCTCFGVELGLFGPGFERQEYQKDADSPKLAWSKLEVDGELRKHVKIPANTAGVLRVRWQGKSSEPVQLRLRTTIWTRGGPGQTRSAKLLEIVVNYVQPVRFDQEKIEIGTLGSKDERPVVLYCWSPTRDLEVKPASDNACLKVETWPLSIADCAALQQKLRKEGKMTRVHSAAKVKVTLFEERDGKQLDMGLFVSRVPLTFSNNGPALQEIPLPVLRASIQGDVSLGSAETGGRIDFNFFSAKKGATKTVTLFAPQGAQLKFVRCDPILLDMDAKLKEIKTVGNKTQWEMVVTAKPNRDTGLLPENGVLELRCELPAVGTVAATTRLVRIPVIGTAGSH